ncbi:NAD(P)/FAD-dependent oxidoreductase [Xylophilus sp. GOD-11R]|uniref:NAD(P)/FAD-dependent oxidoreductase n=1 Tax=Xylophilus sp. GOD-11R TaxID=3089814 RepID=UPI00298BCEB4|nr:FAD-dependent oxidoreductase [Xylophilus sp. GOD-11R]WPB55768.1 FAD-dependent oxidoreductase [Xylophilus sp. GOD-11R]
MKRLVIVGAGHAGAQLCSALAQAGHVGTVQLVGAEAHLPYHRPPLSKAYLKDAEPALQPIRSEQSYVDAGVELCLGEAVVAVDRTQSVATLASGRRLPYDRLVLATGTRARRVPGLPDCPDNLHYLRSAADAARLRGVWNEARSLTILGGGFIGLEVAATAAQAGKTVHLFEAAPRLLARAVSPEMANHIAHEMRAIGVHLHLGEAATRFDLEHGRVVALHAAGATHAVEVLLAGIGAEPETGLAEAMGLACDNGIVVDAHMRTSDERVFAIGDCVRFPYARWGRPTRLESVQNANDQAANLAATLTGNAAPYVALPWFWSDQGVLRLQIAGLMPERSERLIRPGGRPGSFSVLHFAQGALSCVESVNAPVDHMAARALLAKGITPDREAAVDPRIPLKSLI